MKSESKYMRNTLPIKHPCAVSAGLVALSDNPSSGPEWYMSARSAEIKIKQCSGQHDELQTAESPLKTAWVEKVGYDGRQDVWQTKETFIEERFIHHMKTFKMTRSTIYHRKSNIKHFKNFLWLYRNKGFSYKVHFLSSLSKYCFDRQLFSLCQSLYLS